MVAHSIRTREPLRYAFFQEGFIAFASIFAPYKVGAIITTIIYRRLSNHVLISRFTVRSRAHASFTARS